MNAWLTLDFVSKRYGYLPSELLEHGSSIDVKCAILAIQYETHLQQQATAQASGEKVTPTMKSEDMARMLADTRSKHEAKVNAKKRQDSQGTNATST